MLTESNTPEVTTLEISAEGKESYKVGDWVVRINDPDLVVCVVKNILKDENGKEAYEVTDGKNTHLIWSVEELGTYGEGIFVGCIRYIKEHPDNGQILFDELSVSPNIEIQIGPKAKLKGKVAL